MTKFSKTSNEKRLYYVACHVHDASQEIPANPGAIPRF